jgi:two-component system, sensor histidine kinase and response regulator
VASNGKEALKKYHSGSFDFVLTDIEMPEMDGYGLTAEIRRLEAGTGRSMPIFAITAGEFDLNTDMAKERGFTGHMLKPLDLEVPEKKLAECYNRTFA